MWRGLTTCRGHWEAQRSAHSVGSIPESEEHALRGARLGAGQASGIRAPYKAKEGSSVETQAGRGDLFFRNRIPCGAQSNTQWALESGTCLFDSAGVKRAAHWPGLTSQSQHRKCLADLNVRAPNLFWLPGSTASPGSAVGSNDISAQGCAVSPQACPRGLSAPAGGAGANTQEASRQ